MRTNLAIFIVLCALFGVFAASAEKNGNGLLIVTPNSVGARGFSKDSAYDLNENKFMLTYFSSYHANVKALGSYEAIITETNYTCPFVMGYPIINGGFFTKEMQNSGRNAAVLNKNAAFCIYGGYDITGNEITINNVNYSVAGVIDDFDEGIVIYTPLSEKNPTELVCLLNEERGVSSEYIKSELKYIGITEDYFNFTDNTLVTKIIKNNFLAAAELLIIVLVLFALKRCAKDIKKTLSFAGKEMESVYFTDFCKNNKMSCLLISASAVSIPILISVLFLILTNLLEKSLLLYDTFDMCVTDNYFIVSSALLAVFVILTASTLRRLRT